MVCQEVIADYNKCEAVRIKMMRVQRITDTLTYLFDGGNYTISVWRQIIVSLAIVFMQKLM